MLPVNVLKSNIKCEFTLSGEVTEAIFTDYFSIYFSITSNDNRKFKFNTVETNLKNETIFVVIDNFADLLQKYNLDQEMEVMKEKQDTKNAIFDTLHLNENSNYTNLDELDWVEEFLIKEKKLDITTGAFLQTVSVLYTDGEVKDSFSNESEILINEIKPRTKYDKKYKPISLIKSSSGVIKTIEGPIIFIIFSSEPYKLSSSDDSKYYYSFFAKDLVSNSCDIGIVLGLRNRKEYSRRWNEAFKKDYLSQKLLQITKKRIKYDKQ